MITHWLVQTAARAGLVDRNAISIDASADLEDTWERVARACGIPQEDLARAVATSFRTEVADMTRVEPNITRLLPEGVARKYNVFPLRDDYRHLVVATCDPTNPDLEQMVRFSSGREPVIEITTPGQLQEATNAHYSSERAVEMVLQGMDVEGVDAVSIIEDVQLADMNEEEEASTAPVIKLANLILLDAIKARASDIHVEPGQAKGTIRFRVDGVLRKYMQMPIPALKRVVSRIKILAKLDIADRLRPQDGRARVLINSSAYDLRISTVPTGDMEKLVIRVLNTIKTLNLVDLKVPEPELSRIRTLSGYRNSLVIVTGPTGSGKTTTLYAALKEIASSEVNVMTVEDPVEYDLPGISQIQVEPRQGVTFASALRSILRQDPDVILVGEIRDLETATIALQASMTGHLVLATLHTNDAASAVARLTDLGLDRAGIAASLRGVVAQRLLRALCADCAEPMSGPLSPEEETLSAHYGVQPRIRAVGCARCGFTGYLGRRPVMEVLSFDSALREMIANNATSDQLETAATAHGFRPMLEVGLERVRAGETTLQEVHRVLGEREGTEAKEANQAESGQEATVSDKKVLVVDDDPVIRKQALGLLERSGYLVAEARNGREAIEMVGDRSGISLVVTDLQMPELGGREMLSTLRKDARTADLPVIVLTGSSGEGTESELIEEGADDYIRKPIEPAAFLARVKATMRRAA